MTRLILIRHGQTDYNSQNRYCGFSDPPLNNRGIWQSKRLAVRLKDVKIDKVYSSDLKRACQTAEIVFKENPIEKMPDLREINFGIFEGLTHAEIVKSYPRLYRDWINSPAEIKIPNAESLIDLRKRIKQRLSFILSQYEKSAIAIVTHGGPIRIMLCETLKFNLNMFWQIEQKTAALNIIDYPRDPSPVVVGMNDISHLSSRGRILL